MKQNLKFLSKDRKGQDYKDKITTGPKSMVSKRIVSIKKTITRIFSNKRLILTPIFIILISLPLIYFALFTNTEKVVAWFDESFGYRQRVDITNSGSAQTDFQVSITLNTSALISAGKMQSDCDDIRLTDGNGKLLPIWIETGSKSCNTTTTAIWTKLSSIPTSGTTVYVYYGNPSVGSVQNGNNVFEFFDDFNASTIDSTKWTQGTIASTSGTNFSQSGGNLVGGNTNRYIQSVNSYSGDYAAETRVYTTTAPANGFSTVGYYASSSNNFGILDHNGTSFYRNDSSWVNFVFNGTGQWSRNLVKVIGTNATYSRVGENSGSSTASTTNSGLSSEFLRLSARYDNGAYDQNYSATWDWIFIRKTASSEPSVGTPTNEEKSPAPVAYWKFDEGYGNTTQDSSPNNNDGTITTATWQSDDMCLSGKCLKFNGSSDYVTTYDYSLDYNSGTSFSLWFKPTSNNTGGKVKNILGKSNFEYILAQEDQKIRFIQWDPSGQNALNLTTGNFIIPNNWYHLYFLYNSTEQKGYIYINGVNVAEQSTVQSSFINRSDNLIIAHGYGWGGSTTPYFNGFIDDVKIYNYTRTADQIKADYNSKGSSSSGGTSAKLGASTRNNSALSDGLVGYWKMDEASWNGTAGEVLDTSGNGNNGTRVGDATTAIGKFGKSGIFDGTGDQVAIANSSTIEGGSQISFSAWVKPSSIGSYKKYLIKGTSGNYSYGFSSGPTSYETYALIRTSDSGGVGAIFNTNLSTTSWSHLTGVYDGATIKLYLNGTLVATNTATGTITTNTSSLSIGSYSDANESVNGLIDEVRVYNRALSPAEVQALYNWAPGPIGHWKLDEGSGQNANDSSGNNNIGQLGTTSGADTTDPAWNDGKYGKGLNFDGSDDFVSANGSGISGTSAFTLSAWIKAGNHSNYGLATIIGNSTFNQSAWIGWATYAQVGTSNSLGGGFYGTNYGSGITDNNWHYVSFSFSGGSSGTATLYVDGIVKATSTHTPDILNTATYFGKANSGTSYNFNGQLDDVRIYNYARTQAQIVEDMNSGHPAPGSPVGSPALYWKFDEGYGTTANDISINNLDGTITCSHAGTGCNNPTWQNGKFGKSLYFNPDIDSKREYVTLSSTALNIASTTGATSTFSMWVNPNASQVGGGWLIRNGTGADENYGIDIGSPSGGNYKVNLTGYDNTWRSISTTNYILPASTWSHLVVVFSQGQWMKVYINGQFKEQVAWPYGNTVQSTSSFNIGGHAGTYQNYNGYIDEVKVYNFALDSGQILTEYNSAKTLVFGSLGTDTSGNPSNSASREYCPPGNFEGNCATGQNPAPIGEWKYDDPNVSSGQSVVDTSGNNNHGQLGSSSGVDSSDPTWVNGKVGKALKFDGNDDYADLSALSSPPSTAITVSTWVKPSSYANFTRFITRGRASCSPPWTNIYLGTYDTYGASTNRTPRFALALGGALRETSRSANYQIEQDRWSYLVGTYDGSSLKLYADGILLSTVTTSGTIDSNSYNFVAGTELNGCTGTYFNGLIDDTKIYNYARTPAQIAWDYNRGKPVAHYKLDECQGTTVYSTNETYNSALNGTWNGSGGGTQTSAGTCSTSGSAWYNGRNGKLNSSLNFDGSDDYLNLSTSSTYISSQNAPITIALWLKPSTIGSGNYANRAITISASSTTSAFILGFDNTNQAFYFDGTTRRQFTGTFSTNTWYHLAVTFNGSQAQLYLNGIPNGTPFSHTLLIGHSTTAKIGTNPDSTVNFYTGQIDDVRIYNYALTLEQIKLVMNDNSAISFK